MNHVRSKLAMTATCVLTALAVIGSALLGNVHRASADDTIQRAIATQVVEGVVIPDSIADRQPFTFAVQGTVEGEVVNVKTVEGEVVSTSKPDHYGRVFLAAGLAAGTYMIATGNHNKPTGQITINPGQRPISLNPSSPCQAQIPGAINMTQPLSLKGQGFNPNAADMMVRVGSGDSAGVPILAATDDQIKLAPITGVRPGACKLTVANVATGETSSGATFLYSLDGKLQQRTIVRPAGKEAHFVLNGQPAETPMKVRVNILSGPVNFGAGRKETEVELRNGTADIPVRPDPSGSGKYQIGFGLCETPSVKPETAKTFTDQEIDEAISGLYFPGDDAAFLMHDQVLGAGVITASLGDSLKKKFLKWWLDYLEAMSAYEMLDGWITSPFHWPLREDEVRSNTRTQITALTDGAKKKLIDRLKEKAKKLRDKAKEQRKDGQEQKAQMSEDQAKAMDQAADEVGNSMSPAKP